MAAADGHWTGGIKEAAGPSTMSSGVREFNSIIKSIGHKIGDGAKKVISAIISLDHSPAATKDNVDVNKKIPPPPSEIHICVGDTVKTIYGQGIVKEIRVAKEGSNDTTYVIESFSWTLANNCKPTFYLQHGEGDSLGIFPAHVGDTVKSIYGVGIIEEVRKDDYDGTVTTYKVTSSKWIMANDQKPTFYLQSGQFVIL